MARLTAKEKELLERCAQFVLAGEWPWEDDSVRVQEREAATLLRAIEKLQPPNKAAKPFTVMVPGEDGWTEWVTPLPPYHMQCCDCGLIHEAEFRIAKDRVYKPDGSWDAMWATDPNLQVIFRMRRQPSHNGDSPA